jgi:hypothetical protein
MGKPGEIPGFFLPGGVRFKGVLWTISVNNCEKITLEHNFILTTQEAVG